MITAIIHIKATHDLNEIRNRIEAKGDIPESKNNNRNKKMQEYQNKREGESSS